MKNHYNSLVFFLFFSASIFSQTQGSISSIFTIDSYATFQGYDESEPHLGQGEYQIYYDNIDGVLDKPIIICDGFDPEDTRDISTVYGMGNYAGGSQNVFDDLRNLGNDIILLNFPNYTRTDDGVEVRGGADYIERNGLVLVNLIETIKSEMSGSENLVVIGPSMGGLITRYALTYMESNNLDHQTGIWISFDSPQMGANVPISFQYAVHYMAEKGDNDDLRDMRDIQLNSAAAKQMLLDHYIPHMTETEEDEPYEQEYTAQLPMPHEFRATFLSNLSAQGDFPQQTRNLAIIDGSLNGTMVEYPGVTIIDTELDLGDHVGLDMEMYFTPYNGVENYVVDYLEPTYYGVHAGGEFYGYATSPDTTSGLDSAPGGTVLFDSYFDANADDVLLQFQEALLIDAFSFIPTMSSLATTETDWYHVVNGTETIPFDDYIGGNDNLPHLTLTNEYATYIIDEIGAMYLANPSYISDNAIKLLDNPVSDVIRLRVTGNLQYLKAQLYTLSGQRIASHNFQNLEGVIEIPSPTKKGVYLMYLENDLSTSVKKIIVK